MSKPKPIPEGCHTLTASLVVSDGARAIDFYKRAFNATERSRFAMADGKIGHAELKIGDSIVMLSDEFPGASCRSPEAVGGTTVNLYVYTENVDSLFNQAVKAGATVKMPVGDMFWGDRFGQLTDPFGHCWSIATHKEDVAPEEMQRRAAAEMAKMTKRARQA
jgi:PhnB protein